MLFFWMRKRYNYYFQLGITGFVHGGFSFFQTSQNILGALNLLPKIKQKYMTHRK
jgi:hypothetical protein